MAFVEFKAETAEIAVEAEYLYVVYQCILEICFILYLNHTHSFVVAVAA